QTIDRRRQVRFVSRDRLEETERIPGLVGRRGSNVRKRGTVETRNEVENVWRRGVTPVNHDDRAPALAQRNPGHRDRLIRAWILWKMGVSLFRANDDGRDPGFNFAAKALFPRRKFQVVPEFGQLFVDQKARPYRRYFE